MSSFFICSMQRWADHLYRAWESARCVFIFGNGGSATTASHFAEDLGKSTLKPEDLKDESKKRLKVLSLTDNVGWLLAVGNDVGYDQIFTQQLMRKIIGATQSLVCDHGWRPAGL